MYKFETRTLRVCHEIFQDSSIKNIFKKSRFILIQHLLSDTKQFVEIMVKAKIEIYALVVKPYSVDEKIKKEMGKYNFKIIYKDYKEIEDTRILDNLIIGALNESEKDEKSLFIIDVGGYFLEPLLRISHKSSKYIKGIVEVTKFGHNRYYKKIEKLKYPVISIAESPIKTIEGQYVGMAAITALDNMLREFGLSISGKRAMVIGFGLIGKSVAAALRQRNLPVTVYDKNSFPLMEAFTLGYLVGNKQELLKKADLILSSTATRSIDYEDLLICKDGCVIGSVGSKRNEIDVDALNKNFQKKYIHKHITKYEIDVLDKNSRRNKNHKKKLYLLKKGESINFLVQSCPEEIIDLIFAEIIYCCKLFIEDPIFYCPKNLHKTPVDTTNIIAHKWLVLAGINNEGNENKK